MAGKGSKRRDNDNHLQYVENYNRVFRKESNMNKVWCTASGCEKFHTCSRAYNETVAEKEPLVRSCDVKSECYVGE